MPTDGRVLCLCGNPDNCSCPPAPVSAEDLATRIVRWTTDGKSNVRAGDQILDQGEMCTVEDVYVEGLGKGSPWMHVMLRDPRAANMGLPVHAAEFSGAGFVAVRSAALAGDPGDLPDRMAEAIVSHEWTDFPRSAHNQHNYYAECAVCQRDVPRIAEVALSVLLEDPGDLPDRMSDAIDNAIISGDDYNPVKAAEAAMSVRDELVAHLAARAAKAEARVGHAEAGAQLSSERLAKAREEHQAKVASLQALADRCREKDWAYAAERTRERDEARAERDRLRALVEGQQKTIRDEIAARGQVEAERDTLLDVKNTTTPARETA